MASNTAYQCGDVARHDRLSHDLQVASFWPAGFRTSDDVERNLLPIAEDLGPSALECFDMHEHIARAVIGGDEAKAPRVVEKFHGSLHWMLPFIVRLTGSRPAIRPPSIVGAAGEEVAPFAGAVAPITEAGAVALTQQAMASETAWPAYSRRPGCRG